MFFLKLRLVVIIWLVVGTFVIFPYIGNNNPSWRTHIFQRGWNHQLDITPWLLVKLSISDEYYPHCIHNAQGGALPSDVNVVNF